LRKRIRTKGFSLIEVLIAIGVVSVGILALLAVFITGTRSNQHGQDLSRATFYARKITEIIRVQGMAALGALGPIPPNASSGLNDADGVFRPLNDPPTGFFGQIYLPKLDNDGVVVLDGGNAVPNLNDTKYERNIQISRASDEPSDYNFSLLSLSVTVRWRGGRSGDGFRQTNLVSLLK